MKMPCSTDITVSFSALLEDCSIRFLRGSKDCVFTRGTTFKVLAVPWWLAKTLIYTGKVNFYVA